MNKSPPSESVKRALVPLLSLMGIDIKYEITKDGFYPRGGGKAEITIKCLKEPLKPV